MSRIYSDTLTAHVNRKGVLDVDVVKGCTVGVAVHGQAGCYQACYAASAARFRGIDFSTAVVRKVHNRGQARAIERSVRTTPRGFFRVGTMGDPCHAWEETVRTVEWLAPHAIPVVITKHWHKASDDHMRRMASSGVILNTSISALDSTIHLAGRIAEMRRYARFGGASIARVVSCDFNTDNPIGERMHQTQKRLFDFRPLIDNPLRVPSTHHLVTGGVIRLRKTKDISAIRSISIPPYSRAHLGHCSGCSDLCGAGLLDEPDIRPDSRQYGLFGGASL